MKSKDYNVFQASDEEIMPRFVASQRTTGSRNPRAGGDGAIGKAAIALEKSEPIGAGDDRAGHQHKDNKEDGATADARARASTAKSEILL